MGCYFTFYISILNSKLASKQTLKQTLNLNFTPYILHTQYNHMLWRIYNNSVPIKNNP